MGVSVFTINQKGTAVLHKDAVTLCDELVKVTEKELLYIILAHDNLNGPYRLKPPEERRQLALSKCFPKLKSEPKGLDDAIKEYISINYEHNVASRDVLLQKKASLQISLIGENEPTRIQGLLKTIDLIDNKLDEIVEKIQRNETQFELKGGGELSFLEQFMLNRESYIKIQGL